MLQFEMVCYVKEVYQAERSQYVTVESADGSEFKFKTVQDDWTKVPVGFMNPIKVSGVLKGRLFSGEKGPQQVLALDGAQISAVNGAAKS